MSRSFWAGISKLHSMFPKGSVEEILVFQIERIFFQQFCDLERKLFNNRLLWRQFFQFRSVSKSLSVFVIFFRMVVKTAFFHVNGIFLGENISFLKIFNCFFFNVRTLSEELHVFRRQKFGRFLKTAIQVYTRIIWVCFLQKPCFKTNCGQLKQSCSLLSGNLWQNCQNCILFLHGITLIEINFFDNRVFGFIFDCWAKQSQSFLQKFSAGLSKLHSTCPKKPFEEKNVFSPKKQLF